MALIMQCLSFFFLWFFVKNESGYYWNCVFVFFSNISLAHDFANKSNDKWYMYNLFIINGQVSIWLIKSATEKLHWENERKRKKGEKQILSTKW